MGIISKLVDFLIDLANDNLKGYSQIRRTISKIRYNGKKDYDCSSAVLSGLLYAGVDIGSATYTNNMYEPLIKAGFKNVKDSIDTKTGRGSKIGDIYLRLTTSKRGGHTFCIIDTNLNIVQATSDYDGVIGDSSTKEIRIQPYYDMNADYVLRLEEVTDTKNDTGLIGAVGKIINCDEFVNRREDSNSDSALVGKALKGQFVFINGKVINDIGELWYYDSIGNWIFGQFVEVDDSKIPVLMQRVEEQPVEDTLLFAIKLKYDMNIRFGAGGNFGVKELARASTTPPLGIAEVSPDGVWGRIQNQRNPALWICIKPKYVDRV